MSRIISLCGNIGSGKSTLVSNLNQDQNVYHVVQEPITEMNDLLVKYYKDLSKWAFHLQCKVLLLYNKMKQKFCKERSYIVERSPIESKCIFAQALLDSGELTKIEFQLYEEVYESLGWEPDMIIYVRVDAETCYERIKQRSRECESQIPMAYIEQLHHLYENFYEKYKYSKNFFVVDGNQNPGEVYQQCKLLLNIK
jgi:deoxyadenosine/deoxycytidine kinase